MTHTEAIAALMQEFGVEQGDVIDAAELAREEMDEHGEHVSPASVMERTREVLASSMPCPECERSNGPHYRGACEH